MRLDGVVIREVGDWRRVGIGSERPGYRVDDIHILNLRRQLAALAASAPRAPPNVRPPDVQQRVFRMVVNVGERALFNESDRVGIGHAQIAARSANAVVAGREIFGMLVKTIARQQLLQNVAAVLDANPVLAQERRDFVDLQASVVRVADV